MNVQPLTSLGHLLHPPLVVTRWSRQVPGRPPCGHRRDLAPLLCQDGAARHGRRGKTCLRHRPAVQWLEVGIEGGIHAMHILWEENKDEEDWGSLLVDTWNAFNEQNHLIMLWTVWHEWPSGARFVFNCYRHWVLLMCCSSDGTAFILYIQEGVTQGDPLTMVAYGLGVLPLIRPLKALVPVARQPWYANDGAGGTFAALQRYFENLLELGSGSGILPLVLKEHPCCHTSQP